LLHWSLSFPNPHHIAPSTPHTHAPHHTPPPWHIQATALPCFCALPRPPAASCHPALPHTPSNTHTHTHAHTLMMFTAPPAKPSVRVASRCASVQPRMPDRPPTPAAQRDTLTHTHLDVHESMQRLTHTHARTAGNTWAAVWYWFCHQSATCMHARRSAKPARAPSKHHAGRSHPFSHTPTPPSRLLLSDSASRSPQVANASAQ
jgi:hypothetical protein